MKSIVSPLKYYMDHVIRPILPLVSNTWIKVLDTKGIYGFLPTSQTQSLSRWRPVSLKESSWNVDTKIHCVNPPPNFAQEDLWPSNRVTVNRKREVTIPPRSDQWWATVTTNQCEHRVGQWAQPRPACAFCGQWASGVFFPMFMTV